MSKFFGANTGIFCTFKLTIYNTMLHVFGKCLHCLLFMERFVCNLHAYLHICSTGRHGTVEKCVKHFGVLGVSGLNK